MKTGWLINDCLTCIPGTKTFWHDLLEAIPGLIDKTNGYTSYEMLAGSIESQLNNGPNYLIRNASYFRRINTTISQISLLQDIDANRPVQIDVCNNSRITVYNSEFVRSKYPEIKSETVVIPLGTDFDLFKPSDPMEDLVADIIYIGSSAEHPKGFSTVQKLINETDFTFNLVMKDDFRISHPRVRVFNKIDRDLLIPIINSSKVAICTSKIETLHLAGVECGACGIPIVATNTGIYYGLKDGEWGVKSTTENFAKSISYVLENIRSFNPRQFFVDMGVDKKTCMNSWINLIASI